MGNLYLDFFFTNSVEWLRVFFFFLGHSPVFYKILINFSLRNSERTQLGDKKMKSWWRKIQCAQESKIVVGRQPRGG